ncbi:MAG: DUF47 domain-containing protein [Acidobacteriota bacterium]
MLKRLLRSRQNEFFGMLIEIGDNVEKGVELLAQLVSSPRDADVLISQIKQLETRGDDHTRALVRALNSTFITPFDREDVHKLAEMMDDILDYANETATRFKLFGMVDPVPDLIAMTQVFREQAQHLAAAMRRLENHRELFDLCARVDELETRADHIYNAAIARLFQQKLDPIELIKQKDLIEILEKGTDECEDISDLIKSIAIKYA